MFDKTSESPQCLALRKPRQASEIALNENIDVIVRNRAAPDFFVSSRHDSLGTNNLLNETHSGQYLFTLSSHGR